MQDAECASGIGPDQHQGIAVLRNAGECFLHVSCGMHGLAVNFRDHVTLLQTGVICRAAGSDLLDHGTVHVVAGLQLLPDVRRQVLQAKAPARLTMAGIGALVVVVTFSHRFQRDRHVDGVAVAQGFEVERGSGLLFSDFDLQLTGVTHRFSVKFGDDIADLQACFRARRVRLDLSDDGSRSVVHVEELGFIGRNVADADADIAVAHLSVFNETVNRWLHDLRGNGKSHAGKTSGLGDQKRVDADDFAVGIDQRPAGVAWVDRGVRLDELARRTAVSGEWIGTVQRTDDAARHGETESQRIAECEYGLAGMQLGRISQRHARQVGAVDLDDGKIRERIGADELRRQDSAVGHGDANVDCAVDDVVVGHDVAIGRNDHAAAQTVLNVRLRPHVLAKAVLTKAELLTELGTKLFKELLQSVGVVVAAVLSTVGWVGRSPDLLEVTVTLTMAGVTRAASASMA